MHQVAEQPVNFGGEIPSELMAIEEKKRDFLQLNWHSSKCMYVCHMLLDPGGSN